MAAVPRPVTKLEERFDGLGPAGLRGEMQGGHALSVVGAAEGPATIDVGAELDEAADRRDASVACGPGQRRAAIRVSVGVGAELISFGSSDGCQAGKPPCGR